MEEFENHNCETSLWMGFAFTKTILWGGRGEGGSGWGTHVHPWQIFFEMAYFICRFFKSLVA